MTHKSYGKGYLVSRAVHPDGTKVETWRFPEPPGAKGALLFTMPTITIFGNPRTAEKGD